MSLGGLIIVLVLIGVVLYLVPMDAAIKKIVIALIAVGVCIWLLEAFGLFHTPFPHLR